jgi:hypothetical protein
MQKKNAIKKTKNKDTTIIETHCSFGAKGRKRRSRRGGSVNQANDLRTPAVGFPQRCVLVLWCRVSWEAALPTSILIFCDAAVQAFPSTLSMSILRGSALLREAEVPTLPFSPSHLTPHHSPSAPFQRVVGPLPQGQITRSRFGISTSCSTTDRRGRSSCLRRWRAMEAP